MDKNMTGKTFANDFFLPCKIMDFIFHFDIVSLYFK